ncbi:MAG: 30S ribosomal protein S4 [Nanoarchaeota archaeon]|nr:30S ribosomal protein S4 [Nanoarchaeota archaeon]
MPKRKRKQHSRPRRPFDKVRIGEENVLKEKYGLKNKKEIWKADSAIAKVRNLAKRLITKSDEEKRTFIERLQKVGFKVEKIADALALDKEDWLKRRLQTIIFMKKFASTPKQARQFVAHKHVSVGDRIINIPSYQVSLEEEPSVRLNLVLKKENKKSKIEEIKEQILEDKENKEFLEAQINKEQLQEKNLEAVN